MCIEEFGMKEYKKGFIEHVDKEKAENTWIVLNNEEVIATICYYKITDEIAEIKRIYINKNYRGEGIGTYLINMIIEHIKNKGYSIIYLETNDVFKKAIEFYKSYGFTLKDYTNNKYAFEMKLK